MSQVNITVNYEEVVALLSKEKNEAFAYLMEKILNTVSELCKQLDEGINQFKNRQLKTTYPFVIVDAKYL